MIYYSSNIIPATPAQTSQLINSTATSSTTFLPPRIPNASDSLKTKLQSLPTNESYSTTTTSSTSAQNSSTIANDAIDVSNPIAAPAKSGGQGTASSPSFFSQSDLELINSTAKDQVNYILSLQQPNGAMRESDVSSQVYTRDLSLAVIGLTLMGYDSQAGLSVGFLLSLPQGASYFDQPAGSPASPDAWYQIYSTSGTVEEQSLRGEDQGMALFAISDYVQATGDYSLAQTNWLKIENAANFIVYLQSTPEPGMPFTGLYRHGDNWEDARVENRMSNGTVIYWPYWPEYYHWEEENMRMIMGMNGAIALATKLGYTADAQKWSSSVDLAMRGLSDESVYNKYEAYDYFGSVLWGLQSNLTAAKQLMQQVPSDLITPVGIKDLASNQYASSADTIDYLTCLVRIGNLPEAEYYLHLIVSNYTAPSGGFYDSLNMNGSVNSSVSTLYSSARFLYFAYVAESAG